MESEENTEQAANISNYLQKEPMNSEQEKFTEVVQKTNASMNSDLVRDIALTPLDQRVQENSSVVIIED